MKNSNLSKIIELTVMSIFLPILVKISRSLNLHFLFKPPVMLSVGNFSSKAG